MLSVCKSIILASILSLSLLNCNRNTPTHEDLILSELKKNTEGVFTVELLKESDASFSYNTFKKDSSIVSADSAGLVIILNNNQKIELKNKHIEEDETLNEWYEYKGFEASRGLFWVVKKLYEEDRHLVINKETGAISEIWNEPVMNPAGSLFFTKQRDCFMVFEDCPPGFQLWKTINGKIEQVSEVALQRYYIVNGGWKSDTELIVEVAPIENLTACESSIYHAEATQKVKVSLKL